MPFSKLFKRLLSTEFNRNFLILFSTSGLSQLIPIVSSIILVRFYTPNDFGVFTLFNSFLVILTPLSTLRYEFAIPLPRRPKHSVILTFSSIFISLLFSILLLVVFIFFKKDILRISSSEALGNWIYLVPVSVFFGGAYSSLNYFNLRYKKFKVIGGSNILRSSVSAILQVFLGLFKIGFAGLLLGNTFSLLAGNSRMGKFYKQCFGKINRFDKKDVVECLKRYKEFPLISLLGVLINNVSLNINNFFISSHFGLGILGHYSYGYKNLSLPMSIISNNIGQVFYQSCLERKNKRLPLNTLFISVFKKLFLITGPLFLVLFFIIEDLFGIVFGEDWRIAGTYAKILLPVFFIRSIFSPLSLLTMVLEKQRKMLLMQVLILFANVILFFYVMLNSLSMEKFLDLYSIIITTLYIIFTFVLYKMSIVDSKKTKYNEEIR